jgi:hypothetical protein
LSHRHFYAISPVIHNDSFEKVDFNINLHLKDMHYNTMIRTFCIMKKMTFTAFHYLNLSIRCEELDTHINLLYLFLKSTYCEYIFEKILSTPVIHNDSFEKVDFNINLHGDYKSYENFEFFWNFEIFWNSQVCCPLDLDYWPWLFPHTQSISIYYFMLFCLEFCFHFS